MGSDPMKSLDNVIVRKTYASREQVWGQSPMTFRMATGVR